MARRMGRWLLIALVIPALLVSGTATVTAGTNTRNGPPQDRRMAVIVQKADESHAAEDLTERLKGKITRSLDFINAFAADIPASALPALAEDPSVRVVTADSGMRNTSGEVTTDAWATSLGTSWSNGFSDADNIVDSSFGPDGTFGSGAAVKGSFAGFSPEVTPGNRISRVYVLLQAYVTAPLGAAQDPVISVVRNGRAGRNVVVNHHKLDALVGQGGAGLIVADVTDSVGDWQWSDFENALEVRIDQSKFNRRSSIYYDAVGLRVESVPDANATADGETAGEVPLGPIDDTQQLNVYNSVINAGKVWNGKGYLQGNKIRVAVVDSGVVKTKDLDKRNKKNVNFNAAYHDGADRYGHGTFVTGIVAGNGNQSRGRYMGVAPKSDYINVRVSDDKGACAESDVVAGLQWVFDNHDQYNIRVVNLSLNSDTATPYTQSALDAACELLWFDGVVVVCSAGNNGDSTLYPPANDPFVITVGATNDRGTVDRSDDSVASFSAYGSEAGVSKPDIVAPGTNIIGLLPENGRLNIAQDHPANQVDATYFKMSGTSVSAPMVSGAVALLLQDEPNLTPDQVKYRIKSTADKTWPGYSSTKAGAGYIDVAAAVNATTTESENTGLQASELLWTGEEPLAWDSVLWRSVCWRSVTWRSVCWRSVCWRSVCWRSDFWGEDESQPPSLTGSTSTSTSTGASTDTRTEEARTRR